MRIQTLTPLLAGLAFTVACGGNDSTPRGPDAGVEPMDASRPDSTPTDSDAGAISPLSIKEGDPLTFDDPIVVVVLGDAGIPDVRPDSGLPPQPDADGDGISDADEGDGAVDTDNDGTPDSLDLDADNDGIPDAVEGGDDDTNTPPRDFDNDGTPDFRDLDSDGDGLADADEGLLNPDGDGQPAFIDLDADDDGIPDATEGLVDTDTDGSADFVDLDADGDGVADADETAADADGDGDGNWRDLDSDGDTIPDALERLADPDGDQIPAFLDLDSDGDGLSDEVEGTIDFEVDGLGAWLDDDSDGDTIADADEGLQDPDGDDQPAYLDLDSDGDGLADVTEAGDDLVSTPPADPDGDGTPSYLELDADGDTIYDATEGAADQDGDGLFSFVDPDSDGDGIPDAVEAGDSDLATAPRDFDGDGVADYVDPDSDNDLIRDVHEGVTDTDGDTAPDYLDPDADGDGRLDAAEAGDADPATAPIDTDNDGLADFRDIDSDGDGFSDTVETGCPTSTHHLQADSDDDGLVDPIEVAVDTDPCDAGSTVSGLFFVLPPLGPTEEAPLAFNDTDIDRADLAINVDRTGSMGSEINTLKTNISDLIIPGMQAAVAEPGFSVSGFEDYPVAPFGATDADDRPFRLISRVTSDVDDAIEAVQQLYGNPEPALGKGGDALESGLESLYQVATGAGTAWGAGADERVAAFDPDIALVPGVADGTIGGVGFRDGALPIIVHVTDAVSHQAPDYAAAPAITAAPTSAVKAALQSIGARVISIVSAPLPRPILGSETDAMFEASCARQRARFFGRIASGGPDVDWYALTGATAGSTVVVESFAERLGSLLDTVVAVVDGTGNVLDLNDDVDPLVTTDSRLAVALAGTGPFYVAVSSFNDLDFDGTDSETTGHYFLDVSVDGVGFTPVDPTCPGLDNGSVRASATPLVALPDAPAAPAGCEAACATELSDEPFALPYGIAQNSGASILPCAWDEFGVRPAVCGPDECCTGLGGFGQPTNAAGECPLSFEVGDDGGGLGTAVVTGLEALVRFSTFELTTEVRTDPDAAIDTTCFIHQVIPTVAEAPNACVPTPVAVADRWTNVVPGTELSFRIDAQNQVAGGSTACAPSQNQPVAFRAYIDVVADGVTVVDTREVTIVVPATP